MSKEKKIIIASFVTGMLAFLVMLSVYAATITWDVYDQTNPGSSNVGAQSKGFKATAGDSTDFDTSNTELLQHCLHFTDGEGESASDTIRMGNGADSIYFSNGDDGIYMGNGNDTIDFAGASTSTETIVFKEGELSQVKWTGSNNNIEIKTTDGDVIITLAD